MIKVTNSRRGRECRLFGVDFISISAAARYHKISFAWAKEMVNKGIHTECSRDSVRRNLEMKYKFEIDIDVIPSEYVYSRDKSYTPSKSEVKEFLEGVLSWQHPNDVRSNFGNVKIVAKRA